MDADATRRVTSDAAEFDHNAFTESLYASSLEQTKIFDAAESFLAVWARVSLLIFPLGGADPLTDFRKQRGDQLQSLLQLTNPAVLEDRELRNAWMHFDERLDRAVSTGGGRNRHLFARSASAAAATNSTLRVFETDTLIVHFRDQEGTKKTSDLKVLRVALEEARDKAAEALKRL